MLFSFLKKIFSALFHPKILVVVFVVFMSSSLFAAGVNIPASSQVNVNSGQLNVGGDISNSGTLQSTTGTIRLSGNWSNAGTFTHGTGTVVFNGSGAQTLNSGGLAKAFYNLTHSGAGTLTLSTNALDVNNDFINSSGTFNAAGLGMNIGGDWTNSATFTPTANAVTFDGTGQSLTGSTTFYTFSKVVAAADTLTFDNTATQTITNSITMNGAVGQLLSIRSDINGSQHNITLQAGGTQAFSYLNVRDSDASGGLTLIAGSTSTNSGNNINWNFGGGVTITWDGSASTSWDTAANWDLGIVPTAADTVIIPSAPANQPTLASHVSIVSLTINSGATVSQGSFNLTMTDTLSNDGTLNVNGNTLTVGNSAGTDSFSNTGNINLRGTETITFNGATPDTNSGTFTYIGNGDGVSDTRTIKDFGAGTDYYNLVINDPNATKDVFQTAADLVVAGSVTVTNGTLTFLANNIDVNGSVVVNGGTLVAPGAGLSFTIADDFTHSSGTFTHSSGTVTLDTTTEATIVGNTTFNNLTSNTSNKTIKFTAGSTQTVNGTLTLAGTSGNLVTLRSTSTGSKWDITFPNGAQNVTFVDVKDSNANTNTVTCSNCTDSLNNNANWIFITLVISVPETGKTVGRTPTIIGQGNANSNVTIKDGTNAVVATAVTDSSGNFRTAVGVDGASLGTVTKTQLDVGATTLTPHIGANFGNSPALTVVASPTTSQVPIISTPSQNQRVRGATPTISGQGKPSTALTIVAKDSNGNLLLTNVASDSTNASGVYSTVLTTSLPKGANYISVTIDGVASDIRTALFTDPFGVVFDSSSNSPIENATVTIYKSDGTLAVVGTDLDPTDVNPVTTGSDGFYSFLCANGNYTIVVSEATHTYPSTLTSFPSGRTIVTGSKGEQFTVAGVIIEMDHPMDINANIIRVVKVANKKDVHIGDVVTYTVTMENQSSVNRVDNVFLEDRIPAGFKYMKGRALLDGAPISDPSGDRPLVFTIGDFLPGQTRTLRYQLVVGAGVTTGNYENAAYAKYYTGLRISNNATATVKVVYDPLFDMGTILGKVFFDWNENGVQDKPEYDYAQRETITESPVPNIELLMEDGTVVRADQNGMFTIPGITPGRHLVRLNERTLPEGAFLTTDKVVVIDVTPGIATKVNFGVNIDNKNIVSDDAQFFNHNVQLTQTTGKPVPRLNVSLFGEELVLYQNAPIEQVEFRIFSNYASFIEHWKLDIVDKDTKRPVRTFEGGRTNMFDPIYWDGRDAFEKIVRIDRNYSYVLTVDDGKGRFDESEEKPIALRVIETPEEFKAEQEKETAEERQERRRQWVKAKSKENKLAKQSIRVDGETVQINPLAAHLESVRIKKDQQVVTEIAMAPYRIQSAQDLLEKPMEAEDKEPIDIILPNGNYTVEIAGSKQAAAVTDTAEVATEGAVTLENQTNVASRTYAQPLQIGEDYLTFVALGDGKVGYNFDQGNMEPVQSDDKYNGGFYTEGKLAYFLRGKIKGKYLITSSFVSDREQREMFKNLDPEKYYPIYGDSSSVDYQATNTQGKLYLLVEWDKSSVIWGNYAVDLNDTEFAQFSRTLSGGKIDYESVGTTAYGPPKTKVVVFDAQMKQRAAHNEFLGTGGSLFYFKHKDIVEGTDKIKIEVRDRITGLVLRTKDMKEGSDYELDYEQGRVLFWQPISMIAQSDWITSDILLQGNPVYMVADYEYLVVDKVDEGTRGARVQQAVTNNVVVGSTYVKETQANNNYELKGADTTVFLGRDAKVKAEYAETVSEDAGSFISTDGGINFTSLTTADATSGKAYGISQDARLFNRIGLNTYYKWIDSEFGAVATSSQQGKELKGMAMTFDLTSMTRLTARHDIQKLMDNANLQAQLQTGAQETATTAMQIVHDMRRLKLTGEYQKQEVKQVISPFESSTTETDTLAAKAEYILTERIDVSLAHQAALKGAKNQLTTFGVTARVTDRITLRGQQSVGTQGSGTSMGATANVTDKLAVSTDYAVTTTADGQTEKTATIGSTTQVTDKLALQTSVAQSQSSSGVSTSSVAVGGKSQVTDKSSMEVSVGRAQSSTGETRQSVNLAGATDVTDKSQLQASVGVDQSSTGEKIASVDVGGTTAINDKTQIKTTVGVDQSSAGTQNKIAGVEAQTKVDDQTSVGTGMQVAQDQTGVSTRSLVMNAEKQVDEKTQTSAAIKVDEPSLGEKTTTLTLADRKKLNEQLQTISERSFGYSATQETRENKYGIIREKDGRQLEGSVTRRFAEGISDVSQTNIFGLSGDVNDRWALNAGFERGLVRSHDGSETTRNALAAGFGYVYKDVETGIARFKNSTKFELRLDSGETDHKQYVLYTASEGKINDQMSVLTKLEYSQTLNTTENLVEAEYKEVILGAAYRPLAFDDLNVLGRYTYKENRGPAGQIDQASVDQDRVHVLSADVIYDINDQWQLAEKVAYRITEEQVEGFDFTKTHTWLMVHRLNYKIDKDWKVGGEYRQLTQKEAKDTKKGFLLEATRKINDFTQMGLGYNFTSFNDDLTNLDYTTQGPFLRVTGDLYDRTPEEKERARAKWLEEKVSGWAWNMVHKELQNTNSPIVKNLNEFYALAQAAEARGQLDEAKRLYKDIVTAGQMMFEEAAFFIRSEIEFETRLNDLDKQATDYFKSGELLKARKIWEKIVEDAQNAVLE